jgi:tripartite ATP-independent transporter DctP family solute receptor
MEFMKQDLRERSKGRVLLEIFPNGQLGSETESIEQVQRGVLAMVKTSAAPLEGFIPNMALFSLPYLFRDEEHYWNVLHGEVGQELLLSGKAKGLKGLCYYDSGSRSFYTTDVPILSPVDLVGRKIRVLQSKTAMDMISAMGGAPTPIPWGELYTALQQGMVDGAENNPPSFLSSRHFEVTKQYSLDEHTRVPDIVVFSQRIWDGLSPQVQGWVTESAAVSVEFQRKLWKEKTDEALTSLEKAGVKVHRPDKAPFFEKVQSMYEPLKGTPLGALVNRVQEAK